MNTTTAYPHRLPSPREARGSRISLALSLFTGALVFISTVGVFIVANDDVARQAVLGAIGVHDVDAKAGDKGRP